MIAARILLAGALAASVLTNIAPAKADSGCTPGGPPAGAATRTFDGGTVWITHEGLVGVSTAGGSGIVRVPSASPMPLQALVIDAADNGNRQLIVSDGRVAHLYILAGCQIATAYDGQGEPFLFDLENLRGNGTGVGCSDLGDGRHLVGLQALPSADGYVVRRTEIDLSDTAATIGLSDTTIGLSGTTATIGRSDTVTGTSQQDPVVASAMTISCGDQTITQNGVQQP